MQKSTIKIIAHLDPFRTCISVNADGEATIKFRTDATQLARVLTALGRFKDKPVELTLKALSGGLQNGRQKRIKQAQR